MCPPCEMVRSGEPGQVPWGVGTWEEGHSSCLPLSRASPEEGGLSEHHPWGGGILNPFCEPLMGSGNRGVAPYPACFLGLQLWWGCSGLEERGMWSQLLQALWRSS